MKKVHVVEEFNCSPEKLYDYLEVHENLSEIFFPLTVKTVQNGADTKYGVGSVRQLSIGPLLPFEETNVVCDKPHRIEYKITKGSPLKDHHGVMIFEPTSNGWITRLSLIQIFRWWQISLSSDWKTESKTD